MSEFNVGDINSEARGSGARANAGKPQYDLIPVAVWETLWRGLIGQLVEWDRDAIRDVLKALQEWQEGETYKIEHATYALRAYAEDAVRVFEYGKHKYAAWNWAKGMDWNIPLGCVLRHLEKVILGEPIDAESGELHLGHVLCNLIMLQHYAKHYPEGDNRPNPNCFSGTQRGLRAVVPPISVYNKEFDRMEWGDTNVYLQRLEAMGHREECTGL